ncbi:MAG: hypothetical protein J6P71_01370 [Oscillospiraceae bacterium]|nr:hypothetical protein [Oscillospiraceae bacterium]
MLTKIRISFEDGDRAELALSTLRRAGIACRVEASAGGRPQSAPLSPRYCANLLFPHAVTLDADRGPALTGNTLGSRAVLEFPFPPVRRGGGRLELGVAPEKAAAALAILRNRGGYDAH